MKRCVALSGRLLAHDSTADTVRDLDYLRRLVGDRRLNYQGFSYGTFIGETYANMFPRRVRAMVLNGVIDPVPFTTSARRVLASTQADFCGCSRSCSRYARPRGRRVARSRATARSKHG